MPRERHEVRARVGGERRGRAGERRAGGRGGRRRRRRRTRRRRLGALLRRDRGPDPLAGLTPREREVLGLMAEGRSNQGIAERLGVTERAVQKHITGIFQRLGLGACEDDHRRVLAVLAFLSTHPAG
jgi:DNA-binding NarL/FixJ family response regulator